MMTNFSNVFARLPGAAPVAGSVMPVAAQAGLSTTQSVLLAASLASSAVAVTGVLAYGMFAPRSTLYGPVHYCSHAASMSNPRSKTSAPVPRAVSLTFDDGPWPGSTDKILDILKQEGVPATFFVIGRYARQHPDLLRRMHGDGHIIGNHTFDHHRWGMVRWARYWYQQMDATDAAIHEAIGPRPVFFRPPMGFKSPHLMRAARALGHAVVTWSHRVYDGVTTTPEAILENAARSRPGDVILMHDGRDPASERDPSATAAALPRVIQRLRDMGFSFEPLHHFLNLPAYYDASPG